MSHPAEGKPWRYLGRPHVAVAVQRQGRKLVVQAGVHILRADTKITLVPKGFQLVAEDGEEIPMDGTFWMTVETFDPFHAVMDLDQ